MESGTDRYTKKTGSRPMRCVVADGLASSNAAGHDLKDNLLNYFFYLFFTLFAGV